MAPQRGRQLGWQRPPPDSLVRSQLDKVLASDLFLRSERLSGFLRFVVEETLNGRGETLKEPVLAHELYGKEADFDGATNPIVRVDARRLRDKLREYLRLSDGGSGRHRAAERQLRADLRSRSRHSPRSRY